MADVITRFKLETSQYDSKLRDASKALAEIGKEAMAAGKDFDKFTKGSVESAKALGSIATTATTTKGKVQELVGAYNDVARAYDKLTQDQKQSDFGKAMAGSLQELQGRIKEAKQELYSIDDAAKKVSSGGLFSGDKLSGMLQVFGGNLMTKGAMMIGNFAAEMGDMVKQGIEMAKAGEGIRIAFERLGRGELLDGLREATHGTVTDLELMKAAVKFNDFKLPVEELGTMLAFAQQKAKDTGQSVDYMVDSIVTGLGRKSLMILDNLGLGAAEIKEKMAQTGDMTKAVGEIIREQMSKAGEYVSTAADQATAADVRLKNAMTDLGDALKPLTSSFNTFWTDIKVSGLNFMREVLTPMLNQLTEAGRIANAMNAAGGSSKVGDQLAFLSGADDKQSTYTSQLSRYNSEIQRLKINLQEIQDLPLPTDVNIRNSRLNSIGQLQYQIKAIEQLRAAYMKGAERFLNPVVAASGGTGGGGAGSGNTGSLTNKETYIPAIGSIDEMKAKLKELQDEFSKTADQSIRGQLLVAIDEVQKKLDFVSGKGLTPVSRYSGTLSDKLGIGFDSAKELKKIEVAEVEDNNRTTDTTIQAIKENMNNVQDITSSVSGILNGIQNMGIEIPEEISRAFGILQTMSSVLTAILTITTLIKGEQEIQTGASIFKAIFPFARGGIVRAAGGTIIPGNSYSGDNLRMPIMDSIGGWAGVNSGELILNRSQQGVLAASLQDAAAGRSQNLLAKVKGTDLIVMLDRTGRMTGRGELAFWKD